MISNRWRHDTSQNWEYLAKNYNNLTTGLILNEILLRVDIYILSIRYLENGVFRLTKVTKYNNICFDNEIVEDEDGEEDSKETINNSKEEVSKKRT